MGTVISVLNKSGAIFCQHGLTMLVQFGLLSSLLFLGDIMIRKRVKASLRYCLWCLLLVKLVLPTTLSLPTGIGHLTGVNFSVNLTQGKLPEPQTQTAYAPTKSTPTQTSSEFVRPINSPQDIIKSPVSKAAESPASAETTPLDWRGGIFTAWLFGVLVLLAGFIRRIASIKKLIAQSEPAPERLVEMVHTCQERIGVKGIVELRLSNDMVSPAVCGLLRHVILVPAGLLEKMDRSKLAMVLMHELSHVKRADLWVNLFQTILQIFYFYNPFVWAANAYARRVREQAVDEMVLTHLNGAVTSYSNTLIDVAEKAFSQPQLRLATVSIIESKSKLKERIKIMLSKPIPKDTKIGFAGLVLIITAAAVMLPMAKGMARKPGPEFVIKGHVNDAATGKPIAGAKVTDSERYAGGKYGAITDSNGNYSYKTWYEEHDVKCEASGYETEAKVLLTKISGSEQEKILDFALNSKKKDVVMHPVDFEITTAKFNRGDSIEITDLSGTALDIRPGATYVVKGRYKLESRDNAMLHVYATNGETSSSQGPIIKRGEGQFTRTFTLLKEGDLHLSFYPSDGGESFGGVYFAQRGADTGTEASQKTVAGVDVAVEDFNISPYPEGGLYTVTASIRNKGEGTSPKFRVCFYKNDPERKTPMNNSAGPIKPGEVWKEGSMPFALKEGTNEIAVVLDPDNTIGESDRTNNEASMKVVVKDGKIVEKKIVQKQVNARKVQILVEGRAFLIPALPVEMSDLLRDKIGISNDLGRKNESAELDGEKLGRLKNWAASLAGAGTLASPQVIVWNGDETTLEIRGENEGTTLKVRPMLQADGRTINMDVDFEMQSNGHSEGVRVWRTVSVADGHSALISAGAVRRDDGSTEKMVLFVVKPTVKKDVAVKTGANGGTEPVISAAEFGGKSESDINNTQAAKAGEQTADVQRRGEEIIKRMAEVNRYWLTGPPAEVKNYSYEFALYHGETKTFKVSEPSSAERTIRQGITYDSLLHKLAKEPSAATYTSIEEVNGIIRADFKLKESIQIRMGNGLRGSWYGSFNQPVEGGTFWIDAKKMFPVRAKCNEVYEYFSDYAAVDKTHYVPLRVKIDKNDMPNMHLHFDWTFKLHKPGVWLFDGSHYSIDENKPVVAASIDNVRVNEDSSAGSDSVQGEAATHADNSPPVVVKTTPKTLANDVSADLNQITVTFNQQMTDKSWSWVRMDIRYPETTGSPYYDNEKKTCTLPVKLEAGKAYLVAFNIEPYLGFVNSEGKAAKPYVLVFATKDKDGKPTPIPEDLITKAKSVNEGAQKTSSGPEGKESRTESAPYTQIIYDDIRPDGTIFFKNPIRETNKSGREITTQNFINSDFVQVTAMRDVNGRDLKFTSLHDGDIYRYEVTFNESIPPNGLIEYTCDGTMKGLIKPVAGSEKTFQYYMRHSPAVDEPTQRVETYLLPAGAELISTTPTDMERRTKDGRIELHVEKMIPPGGSITTSFQYRVP